MSEQQWENMTPERQKLWEQLAELNTILEEVPGRADLAAERDEIAKQLGLPKE